jgi:hypothetical protein
MLRTVMIHKESSGKYVSTFYEDGAKRWTVVSYIIVSHEVMVDWIERSILPEYSYT